MKNIDLRQAFIHTKDHYGITGAALSRACGVSQKHISQFISLKKGSDTEYKSDLTTTYFGLLLFGMQSIEPQSLTYFFNYLYGSDLKVGSIDSESLVNSMSTAQMSDIMFAIASKIGNKSGKTKTDLHKKDEQMLVTY